ncbi:MAG: sigma-54-dependent Fis family transcriptional regulator [Desulfobacteria bacterium]
MERQNEKELSFNPAVQQKELLYAWRMFIDKGQLLTNIVPPLIAESWKRSREFGIDPNYVPDAGYLDPGKYQDILNSQQYIISIAKPILENIYRYLEQSRYVVVLYDPNGYHLIRIGQRADFQRASQFAIREGLCFAEESMGTTGFSLAKRLLNPVQIVGCEHYHAMLHYVVGSYAPLIDPLNGNLIGVAGIAGARTLPYPHTLSLAVAAKFSIESNFKLDQRRKVFVIYGKALQKTMDSLNDGVFLVEDKGKIFELNKAAKEIFNVQKNEDVRGKHFSQVVHVPELAKLIQDALSDGNREAREIEVQIGDSLYLASTKFSHVEKEGGRYGVIVNLRNVNNLSRLVQQVVGDQHSYSVESMVGEGEKIQEIKRLAKIIAASDASVIIEGESGTGKEVLANIIHNISGRVHDPFVVVNCASIPSELMESTLFGHERGSFTGAIHTHVGKFEQADKGTVFLDEIGEMPLMMQAKLLRVLESQTIERVGGNKQIPINVRVIAATNQELTREVNENRFRGDLFFRLSVFRLILPPLRERKEDIYGLVRFFVSQLSPIFNKKVNSISEDYLKVIMNYHWPGNVRELKNAVKYSMAIMDGQVLMERHIAGFITQFQSRIEFQNSSAEAPDATGNSQKLSDFEMVAIRKALAMAQGNKSKAAKLLGIGRATLHRKLKIL